MDNQDGIEGVIFDCDGTLADTMPLHYKAWVQALAGQPFHFDEKLFYELGGVPSTEIVRILNKRYHVSLDPVWIVARKEGIYVDLIPQAQPIHCVVNLVHEFAGRYPMAVASGGIRMLVGMTLDALGIKSYFKVIATSEDVERGKPEPDLFLFAAHGLGVPPDRCVVYEDSALGLEAARRAGMRGVDVAALLEPAGVG